MVDLHADTTEDFAEMLRRKKEVEVGRSSKEGSSEYEGSFSWKAFETKFEIAVEVEGIMKLEKPQKNILLGWCRL